MLCIALETLANTIRLSAMSELDGVMQGSVCNWSLDFDEMSVADQREFRRFNILLVKLCRSKGF